MVAGGRAKAPRARRSGGARRGGTKIKRKWKFIAPGDRIGDVSVLSIFYKLSFLRVERVPQECRFLFLARDVDEEEDE